MVRQIFDQPFDHFLDVRATLGVESAAIGIGLREYEGLERHVIVLAERMLLEERLGETRRLIRIRSKREQIKAFLLRERRPVAEQDLQKSETLHVPAQH